MKNLLIETFETEASASSSGGKSGSSSASGTCMSVEQYERPNIKASDILAGIQSIGKDVALQTKAQVLDI